MARLTKGYTFQAGEQLTPEKMNQLLNDGDVTDVQDSDFSTPGLSFAYGNAAPQITTGQVWYDTTTGQEGLKYSYLSPSNASITTFLQALPYRSGIFWCFTSVSLGSVLVICTTNGPRRFECFETYDGGFFPHVYPEAGDSTSTSAHGGWVIAMESTGSGPIQCAWTGLLPATTTGSPITEAGQAQIDHTGTENQSIFFVGDTPARQSVLGVIPATASNSAPSDRNFLIWNSGAAIQDAVT